MSRLGTNEIIVKPRNNVYTALAAAGCIVVAVGLIALFVRAAALNVHWG